MHVKRRRMPVVGAACIVVVLLPMKARATTLVLLATEHFVVVAADSRLTGRNARGTIVESIDTACKVSVDLDMALATFGTTDGPTGTGPGFRSFWKSAAGNGEALLQRVQRMEQYAARSPIRDAHLSTELYVVGLQQGSPVLYGLGVFFSENGPPRRLWTRVPAPFALAVGSETLSEQQLDELKAQLDQSPQVDTVAAIAVRLIEQEATRNDMVGGPVDVVVVDRAGTRWWRVKPQCR